MFTPESKAKHKSIIGKLTPVSRNNYKEFLHTSKQTVQVPVSRSIYKDPLAQTVEQTRTTKDIPLGSKQPTKQNDPQNPEQSERLEESQQPFSSVIDPKCDEILKQAQQEVLKFSKSEPLQNHATQDGKPLAVKVKPTQQLVDHVKTGSSEIQNKENTTIVYVSRKRFKINDLPLEERAQWRRFFEAMAVLAFDRSRTGIDPRSDRNIGYRLIPSLDLISNHINRSIRLIKWPISIRFGAFIPKLSVGSSCNLQIRSVSWAALISLRFSSNP